MIEEERAPRSAWAERLAPSLEEFEVMALAALQELPEPFRDLIEGVSCRVAEFPEDDVLDEFGMESPYELLGLFQGIGKTEEGVVPPTGQLPNHVWLYRRPILDYWAEHDETLGAIVTHVLIHEIGHHFGFSDDDMEAIEAAAEAESG